MADLAESGQSEAGREKNSDPADYQASGSSWTDGDGGLESCPVCGTAPVSSLSRKSLRLRPARASGLTFTRSRREMEAGAFGVRTLHAAAQEYIRVNFTVQTNNIRFPRFGRIHELEPCAEDARTCNGGHQPIRMLLNVRSYRGERNCGCLQQVRQQAGKRRRSVHQETSRALYTAGVGSRPADRKGRMASQLPAVADAYSDIRHAEYWPDFRPGPFEVSWITNT